MASLGTKRGSVNVNALIVNECFGREERIRTSDSWSRTNNRCTNLLSRLGLFCVQYPRFARYWGGNGPKLDPSPDIDAVVDCLVIDCVSSGFPFLSIRELRVDSKRHASRDSTDSSVNSPMASICPAGIDVA
jgi:hypothetical protein